MGLESPESTFSGAYISHPKSGQQICHPKSMNLRLFLGLFMPDLLTGADSRKGSFGIEEPRKTTSNLLWKPKKDGSDRLRAWFAATIEPDTRPAGASSEVRTRTPLGLLACA